MSTHLNSAMTAPRPVWTFPESVQQLLEAGESEFAAEIIEVFKSQTSDRMRLLQGAVETGRWDEARAQAHAIKGGASQLGADRLAAVCLDIEMTGGHTPAETAALVSQAELLFEEACRCMTLPCSS